MKSYINEEQIPIKTLQPIVRQDIHINIDQDIKRTEESLKEMNDRFEKIKIQQASQSPILSSRRTITPTREERPSTSNPLKSKKFDKKVED